MTLRLLAGSSSRGAVAAPTAVSSASPDTAQHTKRVSEVCQVGVSGQKNDEGLSLLAFDFVGEFVFSADHSGARLDYERLDLKPDGTYVAKVDAHLVNPSVRSYGNGTCSLPEYGTWNAYKVSGQTRVRIRPTTGPARVYAASMVRGHLSLSRRSQSTMLFLADRLALSESSRSLVETAFDIQDATETTRVLPEANDESPSSTTDLERKTA
jgi:hypothetical protein